MYSDYEPWPDHPTMPGFYWHREVITCPAELEPGLKLTDLLGCCDPFSLTDYGKVEVLSTPRPHPRFPSLGLWVTVSRGWGKQENSLRDHGIGANYNNNRWIRGWWNYFSYDAPLDAEIDSRH